MIRILVVTGILLAFAGKTLAADSPPAKPCPSPSYEIAFYHESSIGKFRDTKYNRSLAKGMAVCSDSSLIHVKDGSQTARDQLILKGTLGTLFPPIACPDALHCKLISLADIHAKLQEELKGKSIWGSWEEFRKRGKGGQTSTISRAGFFNRSGVAGEYLMHSGFIVAGQDITESLLFPNGLPGDRGSLQLDICLNAERVDCGATLPSPIVAFTATGAAAGERFKKLPPGLHYVYTTTVLEGDTKPIRTGMAFVLSAHPSWTKAHRQQLEFTWNAMITDPKSKPEMLNQYLLFVAEQASKPAPKLP